MAQVPDSAAGSDPAIERPRAARIVKPVSCHTLRHLFATHVLNRGGKAMTSPLDKMEQPGASYGHA